METKTKRITVDRVEVPDPPPMQSVTITDRGRGNGVNTLSFYPANQYVGVIWSVGEFDTWADLHGDDLDLLIDSLVELRADLKKG